MINTPIVKKTDKVRDHLANERTFLAWIRTSLSVIVFGFIVAKFGVTLREFLLLQNHKATESRLSLYIGIGFMMMGIILSILSSIRYRSTMYRIEEEQFEPSNLIIMVLAMLTSLFGAIIAIYLVLASNP